MLGARDVFIGANAVDYSGYPDCRPEYFAAYEKVAQLGSKVGVEDPDGGAIRIRTPLLRMSKRDIVRTGLQLAVDYSLTHSCYDPDPDGAPCQRCDACLLRAEAFRAEGFQTDPVVERYRRMHAQQRRG